MYKAFSPIFSQTSASDRDLPRPLVPSQILNLHDSSTQFFPTHLPYSSPRASTRSQGGTLRRYAPTSRPGYMSALAPVKPNRHLRAIRPKVPPWLHTGCRNARRFRPRWGPRALAYSAARLRAPASLVGAVCGAPAPLVFASPSALAAHRGPRRPPRATGQAGNGAWRHARYARPKFRVSLAPSHAFRWRPFRGCCSMEVASGPSLLKGMRAARLLG